MSACDGCGREVVKIKRRYKGKGYCAACYKREFKKAVCPRCRILSRLHIHTPDSVCSRCEHIGKPCARCGKTDYKIGKITEYGPVCNACSAYFREQKVCEGCGKSSYWVSRVTRLGGNMLLCPSCGRIDYASCPVCGKYRLLETLSDGKALCKKCMTLGYVACPICGEQMPAGLGNRCRNCYYLKLLVKRIEINSCVFLSVNIQEKFCSFGTWLAQEVGSHRAAIILKKYVQFFQEIDKSWAEIPPYGMLLNHFGTSGVRKFELPMRYLQVSGLITVDTAEKMTESERRRINTLIEGKTHSKALALFYNYLFDRVKSDAITVRSMRCALIPAVKLMQMVWESNQELPTQKVIDTYLHRAPGQRAALTTFIGFLVRTFGLIITSPVKNNRAAKNKKMKLEAELAQLMKSGGEGILFQKKLLGTALAYFHGLSKAIVTSDLIKDIKHHSDSGIDMTIRGVKYWLPEEVKIAVKL